VGLIVVFGERPGPNTDPARPLHPHTSTGAAARLIKMMGMSEVEYLGATCRYNVVDDQYSATTGYMARERVKNRLEAHRNLGDDAKFVVLGRSAAAAFPPKYRYQPFGHPLGDVIIIPHPSGRNRMYNSQDYYDFIVQSLREFLGRSQR
jgi:hypothetical protein